MATTTPTQNPTLNLPNIPRPHSCSNCPSTFITSTHLQTHTKLHHTPPLKCEHCGETFTISTNLSLHTCVVHYNLIPEVCGVCAKMFGSLTEVNKHMLTYHTRGRMQYGCDKCHMAFGAKVLLDAHKEKMHDLERIKCEVCGVEGIKRLIKMHVDRVHGSVEESEEEEDDGMDKVLERIQSRFSVVNDEDEVVEVTSEKQMEAATQAAFQRSLPLSLRRTPHRLCSSQHGSPVCVTAPPSTSTSISPRVADFLSRVKEGSPLEGLKRADAAWSKLRRQANATAEQQQQDVQKVVHARSGQCLTTDNNDVILYDVCVCGGTLGIFLACVLQMKGFRVVVVERGRLLGRKQEWNISREELRTLVECGLLTEEQLESVIKSEWNPSRVGFRGKNKKKRELWVKDVLNVGVAPDLLIEIVKKKFVDLGGVVREFESFCGAEVFDDGVKVTLQGISAKNISGALGAGGGGEITQGENGVQSFVNARLIVDAMGSFSPIVKQMRGNASPDGVCLTLGTCASGPWKQNITGDLIYTFTPTDPERAVQYFWEAFPASENRRTTYAFAYVDCDERRPSLAQMFEDYLNLLSEYQGVNVDDLTVSRALFGFFPCYRNSPIKPTFDRILQIGDAGGLQSPISFGGFSAIVRHLDRLGSSISDVLLDISETLLRKDRLGEIQPYMPALSATWLFQRAMSVKPGSSDSNYFISDLLWNNMKTMNFLGDDVLRPFLQDVVQAGPLSKTLLAMTFSNPLFALKLSGFIGPGELLRWLPHFFSLIMYSYLSRVGKAVAPGLLQARFLTDSQKFSIKRKVDAWTYGSGRERG